MRKTMLTAAKVICGGGIVLVAWSGRASAQTDPSQSQSQETTTTIASDTTTIAFASTADTTATSGASGTLASTGLADASLLIAGGGALGAAVMIRRTQRRALR